MPKQQQQEEEEEQKEQQQGIRVTLLRRDFISIFPRVREEHRQVIVVFDAPDIGPTTVTIDLFDLFAEKQFEAEKQIIAKEGNLYKKYLEEEKKAMKAHIEALAKVVPEEVVL